MKRINIAFAGCGFLGLYQTGVVAALSHHGRGFLNVVERVSGSSVGSLHAAMLVCNTPLDKCISIGLHVASKARTNLYKIPWQDLDVEVRTGLDEILCEDAHKLASSTLYVSVTSLETPVTVNNKLVSTFETRNDLIEVLAQSCYIPFYSGFTVPKQGSEWMFDGSYTDNLPLFEGFVNVKVSAFSGTAADIAPPDDTESAIQIIYKNMPFAVTSSNIKRVASVVVPPSNEGLKTLYLSGYRDGKLYLKKHGMFETSPAPDVLHLFDQTQSTR